MEAETPLPRDVQLPGQDIEAADLDPTIEPEPAEVANNGGKPDDPAADETAATQPDPAGDNPELGNTLIQPDSS